MDTSRKIQASMVIPAPAKEIFALLADPARHPEIDGAGMLRGPVGQTQPIIAIGQTFTMNMHADDLGDYRMCNVVTAYLPGARIGWGPSLDPSCELAEKVGDMDVSGHTYTYDLREVEGGTKVTQTYEWMSVRDEKFAAMFPRVSQEQMEGTLRRIAEVVA